ncbi:type II toxin-antitoxin system RelB family antitoxin [Entomobacter blattae]|uniref:CopG family transcriptional regulator n=1 Tax=Entomobacter blattae TaxID=2762277 RepID=A0A7H1NP40_9PROT|nr:ribbon-helix-helix protein, CopG family [Entomobacter blattae]QNT77550.1 hypothetical protein JGUZn3_02930 [Entomobacter blattae]QNT78474.1 hypothetical protein JGUZn3_12480 [Entomobacter blattae]
MTTTVRLNQNIEERLDFLAKQTGRTKTYYIAQLIENGLDELEDYYLAADVLEKIRKGKEKTISSSDLKKTLDL